ncbi:MAG: hypothetical protein KZQ83_00620 [gamma proteobacterium symbiont of Taylorina sp.]|nr:hypothetical protein [gamma proteobacterium symbiont of Taylorina sp.]
MVDLRKNESDDIYDPFNDGWNERITGIQQYDNPFGVNNWKFYEWEKGWLAADKAIKEEENK